MTERVTRFVALLLPLGVVLVWATMPVGGQSGATKGEWRYYGGDAGSTKYSPLDQINKDNVKDLRIAWRWKTDNFGPRLDFYYSSTPLMVGGVLYATAGRRRDAVAIDAATGETLWMFRLDEGERGQRAPVRTAAGRGLAHWTDGKEERIIHVTQGYRLVALDAKTGRPIQTFGKEGMVDLFDENDRERPQDGQMGLNSPVIVVRDVIVVGAAGTTTSLTKEFPPGHIRGYDVRTGKRLWIFHTIPQPGEVGNETWEGDSWSYTGNNGVWGGMSADEELGYVYFGTDTATNDYYGGHRLGNNLFAESLVCLDARTGKRIWHYQLIHHGLWDYDNPTAPNLVDITVNGRRIKAVVQTTKQAMAYVFDRVTGEPVWPIEERPVPASNVPGERVSPTQPFPTKPAPFDRHGITHDDLIDFTPELKAEAIKIVSSQYKIGPVYTPPTIFNANDIRGVLMLPGIGGGANWQGGAIDPETGMLYVSSVTDPTLVYVVSDPERSNMVWMRGGGGAGPAGASAKPQGCGASGPQGLPMIKPPWSRITAIDLNTGDHVWMVPNGEAPDCVKNHPALKGVTLPKTGSGDRAALLVTKTLLFGGEGAALNAAPPYGGGMMFRAFDKKTGDIVWETKLPAYPTGVPLTYMLNGKQYIVMSAGGRSVPGELLALSLP